MRSRQALLLALGVCCLASSRAFTLRAQHGKIITPAASPNFTGLDWALLIAGSAGWGNYRHQADIAHAYQVLSDGGLPDERIVVMMADDIAHNPLNPHPGKIINRPGGPDVYKGVPKDYTGPAVNVNNFLSVLRGDNATLATLGTSGKVVASGPKDRVFVYYSDHGAPGILGMPFGPFLYADQIQTVLRSKAAAGGFSELVFYIEACESGSIFQGMLDDSMSVYATTASNAFESSWGTYCPGMIPGPGPEYTTCLGDLYSVAFLENSDSANLANETLEIQYELVSQRTSNNFTYQQGSHVLQFGSKVIDGEPAGDYLGIPVADRTRMDAAATQLPQLPAQNVLQRDAELLHLWTEYQRANSSAARGRAQQALSSELGKRSAMEAAVQAAVLSLLQQPTNQLAAVFSILPELAVEEVTSGLLESDTTKPIVGDWSCLRGMVDAWQGTPGCGQLLDQSTMRFSGTFANLCNLGYSPADLGSAAQKACGTESSAASVLSRA